MGLIQKIKNNYNNLNRNQKKIFFISFFSFMTTFTIYYFLGLSTKINGIIYKSLVSANKVWFWISYFALGIFIIMNIKYLIVIIKKDLAKYKEKNLKLFDYIVFCFKYLFIGAYFGTIGYIANLFMLSVFNSISFV